MRKWIAGLVTLLALSFPAAAREVQKSYNALIYLGAVSGGAEFWLSDFPAAPGFPDAHNWIFPPWLPQKLYIVGAYVGQQDTPDSSPSQFAFGIDRGRLSYRNGIPPYHQAGGDTQWDQLASMWLGTTRELKRDFPLAPKFMDRSKDSIWIESDTTPLAGSPPPARTIWFGFNYLVDEDYAPPTPTGWTSIFGPMTCNDMPASTGWTNYTVAQVIDADWFAYSAGSKTRVTISADHISAAYIGSRVPYTSYQASSLHQLTFGGNAGATANGSGLIVSDDMNFGIDTTNGVVVKMHMVDGAVRYRTIQPSAKSYYKAGGSASDPNETGYTTGGIAVNSVVNIEQFY